MRYIPTIVDRLREDSQAICSELETLLLRHSAIFPPMDDDDSGVVFISPYGHHEWGDLDAKGKAIQKRLLKRVREFMSVVRCLLHGRRDALRDTEIALNTVERLVAQDTCTYHETFASALSEGQGAIRSQMGAVAESYAVDTTPILLPDTNALVHNPRLEQWTFAELDRFIICILPTITAEIDALKVNHKNEKVREKAHQLARQFGEYHRRGDALEGVPLGPSSEVRFVPIEPRMAESLGWLDEDNNDDRFIASAIEVIRDCPTSPVALISHDVNLLTKARLARIPVVPPPD